jgi:hypothetical protein
VEKVPISWRLTFDNLKFTKLDCFDSKRDKFLASSSSPLAIYPRSGTLDPGASQSVEVEFTPSFPEVYTYCILNLHSGGYNTQDMVIEGQGASNNVSVNLKELDFGVIRVGTQKSLEVEISNSGLLPFEFYIETKNTEYSVDCEQGTIGGDSSLTIVVSFCPKKQGKSIGALKMHCYSQNHVPPKTILLTGKGSYPKLLLITKGIDFGTALYQHHNQRKFEVENRGAAEARIVFECGHPDLQLLESDEHLTVGPNEKKELTIVYHPSVVEKLSTRAFVYSDDNRGETFMLHIKAKVGIPKLSILPANIKDGIEFGVVRLNKMVSKKILVFNEGTIQLNFKAFVSEVSFKLQDQSSTGGSAFGRRRAMGNIKCPFTMDPAEGQLNVKESMELTISFLPTVLASFEYRLDLDFEYQEISTMVSGLGGKSEARISGPFTTFDYELCRINRSYDKFIQVESYGNLGFHYYVRPEPENGDWSIYEQQLDIRSVSTPDKSIEDSWKHELEKKGLQVLNPTGYCEANTKFNIQIRYNPREVGILNQKFRIYQDDFHHFFEVMGRCERPSLYIEDFHTGTIIDPENPKDIFIGVHQVNVLFTYSVNLVNDSAFGCDFLVQPMSSAEFDVYPLRGYVEPKKTVTLTISFNPTSEIRFQCTLKVIWEGEPIIAKIEGDGGVGQLEIKFIEERDLLLKSLDYGMVPFNTPMRKRFYITNSGLVGVKAKLKVENEDYTICMLGDQVPISNIQQKIFSGDGLTAWYSSIKLVLKPQSAILISVRFLPQSSITSVGDITILSDTGNFMVPLKGKGGTLSLKHKGDLSFSDISTNYTYSRKFTIVNGGSIPSQLTAGIIVVGQSSEKLKSEISLSQAYSTIDPRSQWARRQLALEREDVTFESQLSARDYWQLIKLIVRKELSSDPTRTSVVDFVPDTQTSTLEITNTPFAKRLMGPMRSTASPMRKTTALVAIHSKRRQIFYNLISTMQLTSQSTTKVKPYIRVTPSTCTLPSFGEVQLTVELNLATEDTFLATMVVVPDTPNCPKYEIPITATPKNVSIVCDDTRLINFHRQQIGEVETITRKFTNTGNKDISFKIVHSNNGLIVNPTKGVLPVNGSVVVTFQFQAIDDSVQQGPVVFEPHFSHPITFQFFGGGGFAKASLSRYRRFDFGHCMIGKDTVSFLPIVNEGNAILHLRSFQLAETDTFFKGQNWPTERVSLFPGKSYSLPLVFHPNEENPTGGSLTVSSSTETWEIELIGVGREAVLIVSKVALEFNECLIGNTYEQVLGLKNIGDVNYPVTCQLDKVFPDIVFEPSTLLISPFSESFVTVTYQPTQQTQSNIVFTLLSPYSTHKVPIMVHSGVANLEFDTDCLDFKMFEKSQSPSLMLTVKNTGTVKTSFAVKDTSKPNLFTVEPRKGLLLPKKSVDIKVTYTRHEVGTFHQKLAFKTDVVQKVYYLNVTGQSEETVLRPDEFSLLNMGVCPVLEPTTRALSFTNYGVFPMSFNIPSVYPLKVSPMEGIVPGGETGTVYLTWNPSGGYELRTQLTMTTNIGKFPILVRGRSAFPEVHLSSNYIDFGICAVANTYHRNFRIENKGKVKLHYHIPNPKESSYVISLVSGMIEPKNHVTVDILFTPRTTGKINTTLIVECKGIHYKEVSLVGLGGKLDSVIEPSVLDLERCPFSLKIHDTIEIINNGDITLNVDFSKTKLDQNPCFITVPEKMTVLPHEVGTCRFGFVINTTSRFYAELMICTDEQAFIIPVTGIGVKITLSQRCIKLLQNERNKNVFLH